MDRLEIRLEFGLVPLFMGHKLSEFVKRIRRLRNNLQKAGICMPLVRIRDFQNMPKDEYRILVRGSIVFREQLPAHRESEGHGVILAHLAEVVRANILELST